MLEVAYKDLSNAGKVASKKVMSFTKPEEVFKTMAVAKPTEVFDIEMTKGEKYWEWTKVSKGVAASTSGSTSASGSMASHTATSATPVTKGGWETPEERARKQVYIVRQSSLSNAIATLSVGAKSAPKVADVIAAAREYEAYVFSVGDTAATVAKDVERVPKFDDLEDPLPY